MEYNHKYHRLVVCKLWIGQMITRICPQKRLNYSAKYIRSEHITIPYENVIGWLFLLNFWKISLILEYLKLINYMWPESHWICLWKMLLCTCLWHLFSFVALTNLVKYILSNDSSLLKICNIFHIAQKVNYSCFMNFFEQTGSVWWDWSIFVGISKMWVGNDNWTSFIHLIGVGFLVIWSCLPINFAIQWGDNSKFLNCAWFNLQNWPFRLFLLIRSVSYAFGFPQINLIYAANNF